MYRAPGDFPSGKEGDVLTVVFTVMGIPCLGLNGGPAFKHSEAFSFQVATADQAETDRYWNAIVGNGGQESACGWCKDKWGLSWQITPLALTEAITDPDPAAAKRAFEAMMTMRKIDIAAIEAARRRLRRRRPGSTLAHSSRHGPTARATVYVTLRDDLSRRPHGVRAALASAVHTEARVLAPHADVRRT